MITVSSVSRRSSYSSLGTMCFLGYFDSDSHSMKQDLVKAADQLSEKFRFAYTTAKDVLEKVGHAKWVHP